jgi:hypothetical protein
MITSSESLKNLLKQSTSISSSVEATIEHNMNSLIDGITITSTSTDTQYTNKISNWPESKPNPFKKLFPIDSVLKPFRPLDSGIKYFIFNTNDPYKALVDPKKIIYPSTSPRVYYPGVSTFYKYWVAPEGENANLTVTYKQDSPTDGNKAAITNKIVIRFEKYHQLPSQYTVTVTPVSGSPITTSSLTPNASGVCTLYYNGTTWTTSAPSEPALYESFQEIKSMTLNATNPTATNMIGVIEFSARWIQNISSDITTFSVNKELSDSPYGILPVGLVTSNSLSMNLVNYNQTFKKYIQYNRLSTSFDSTLTYLAKNSEIKTYINISHSGGSITSGLNKYDKIPQGTFYIDTYDVTEFGEVSVTALDGAKYLIETIAPEMLCEGYPVTAILRRLLDSVGFSNYNFNIKDTDTSIPTMQYWWTDGTTTVWEAIQELCRDIQMNACVDEYNVLQFYSRDQIYDTSTRSASWSFNQELDGTTLPNIIQFSQKEVASANSVKVLWQTPITSNYNGTSGPLWESPESFLSAGSLRTDILSNTTAANTVLAVDTVVLDNYSQQSSLYNFQGYVLIDSEIIEFDAMQYQYVPVGSSLPIEVWISSLSDVSKYRSLSKPGYANYNLPETAYFKPTGKYRVKTRGALGTTPQFHSATANTRLFEWSQYNGIVSGNSASITSVPLNPGALNKYKSYLTLSNTSNAPRSHSLIFRPLNAVSIPSNTLVSVPGENGNVSVKSYSEAYHSFGTTIFIQTDISNTSGKYPKQGGGLGFFISNDGREGYFVLIETISSAAATGQKSVRIARMKNGIITTLADTQKTDERTLSAVFGNQSHIIDVKTKILGKKIFIDAYVNGFKISAVDEATAKNGGLVNPTINTGLICHLPATTSIYDYIYATSISKEKYISGIANIYQGQFSNDLIDTAFGDIIYNANTSEDGVPVTKTAIDEFGTVVREIIKVSTKFPSRPAYPLKFTTGMNKFAKLLGSKVSNFGGEAYVLNNSSSTIPLADGATSNFYIYGNTLGQSGQLEYSTDESAEYANKEPVIFESKWLQSYADVESLAKWIKEKVINRGKIVELTVFGNPIISVGDIITIKYPYNGFQGTEKLIITSISHSYSEGLGTSISCRTI